MSTYPGSSNKKFFTSPFIAKIALREGGNEAVRLAYGIASGLRNPSFTGWVVEMDFISQIMACKGGSLTLANDSWEVTDYVECAMDRDSMEQFSNRIVSGCWLLPTKWNQGGYDLACVLTFKEELLLRCVQITNSASRSLNLKYFRELAMSLFAVLKRGIERIDIVVVNPNDVSDFSITKSLVKHSGTLSKWKVGETEETWRRNNEHKQVRVVQFNKTT